jgi:Large polyvalent protein associated domain 29
MKKNSTSEIFQKARNGQWVSNQDLAFLVRQALKRNFPKTKFSVRNPHYSSITVQWVDGPSTKQVQSVIGSFETKSFDGSIDLAYSKSFWLYADGSASHAHTEGTQGSAGCVGESIASAERPDGVPVTNVAGVYISESRRYSVGFLQDVVDSLKTKWDLSGVSVEHSDWEGGRVVTKDWEKQRIVFQEAESVTA